MVIIASSLRQGQNPLSRPGQGSRSGPQSVPEKEESPGCASESGPPGCGFFCWSVGSRCDAVQVTPWLPLISSLVIATVTLTGIRINNRTNRAAIAATDVREFQKWQRGSIGDL